MLELAFLANLTPAFAYLAIAGLIFQGLRGSRRAATLVDRRGAAFVSFSRAQPSP